jgi:hypothetical protein
MFKSSTTTTKPYEVPLESVKVSHVSMTCASYPRSMSAQWRTVRCNAIIFLVGTGVIVIFNSPFRLKDGACAPLGWLGLSWHPFLC